MSAAAEQLVTRLRTTFESGRTRDLDWRRDQLRALSRMLTDNEDAFLGALADDLGKPRFEAWAGDLAASASEADHLRKHLGNWAKESSARLPLAFRPGRASVQHQPRGVVLVVAPWNYPVYLLAMPLAAALAAGNAVVCKPSELAPATSALLSRLAGDYLDPDAIAFVEGGVEETTALLEQRFDHILYTGNGAVGRIVAEAAARHLTPTTLELGGKSPAIVDKDANLKQAASRIAFAKWSNAGQTCIAADHAWVHHEVHDEFVDRLATEVRERYGDDPRQSPDFGRIVNERHAARVAGLLDGGGYDEMPVGGTVDIEARYVAPTVLTGVKPDAAVMGEEIFGPVLPVLGFDDISEPITHINRGDHPLALYVFSKTNADRVLAETTSGGACVNDTMLQVFPPSLPFGGVGASGYGAYHGKWGFETFSHRRAVYRRPSFFVEPALAKAPYTAFKERLARFVY
ncbi:aldehyde dehydrogenase family protein [Nocardioides bizhenqiangii]|uniref:Aldehyde dehydrogenase n=1 Tax=Nocardioides bizhenqiangii TaxID=3095076 RepID=A0ABZ0ZND3_9ACTN|nr:aldehyde dehydrogenase family protein [Nocardioides sp. HM61]WQQ25291.1 aldehyde dehydrogenase family protein [Nocardioides sp. HM61]